MTTASNADGSEDVNDFLRRIREMDERRNREDEERTRRLEEEILKGRQERQARRAERARSVSPTKATPFYTPLSVPPGGGGSTTPISDHRVALPSSMEPPRPTESLARGSSDPDAGEGSFGRFSPSPTDGGSLQTTPRREASADPEKRHVSSKPSPSAAMPSRAAGLAWQRRPDPQWGGSRRRPMSVVNLGGLPPLTSNTMPDLASSEEIQPSRAQIKQSLQSKDPSWFRQTEDRSAASPAYRRSPAASVADASPAWAKTRLPGMSGGAIDDAPRGSSSPPDSVRSTSPSRASSARDSLNPPYNYSTNTSLSGAPLTSVGLSPREPLSPEADTARANGQPEHISLGRNPAMSPSQGRIILERMERPLSPTKGLGGFVQSAMLKRSDSVQKRWSTQSTTGLSRENSVASRGGLVRTGSVTTSVVASNTPPILEPDTHSHGREASQGLESVTESHRNDIASEKRDSDINGSDVPYALDRPSDDGSSHRGSLATHSRSQSTTNVKSDGSTSTDLPEQLKMTPPHSPTKTTEQKRWSPTKASWLESALNKAPESPKMKPLVVQKPSWSSGLGKNKKQEAAGNQGHGRAFQEVKTGGLMRAPPPGRLAHGLASGPNPTKIDQVSHKDEDAQISGSRLMSPPPIRDSSEAPSTSNLSEDSILPHNSEQSLDGSAPAAVAAGAEPSTNAEQLQPAINKQPRVTGARTKPETPPKKDFRSVLKPRQVADSKSHQAEPEFKNVFGKLRHTTTQKYVAPDELKDNILRGKAGLSVTGGPIKPERKDELKESLLKQKEAIKAKATAEKPQVPSKSSASITSPKGQGPNSTATSAKELNYAKSNPSTSVEGKVAGKTSVGAEDDESPNIELEAGQRVKQATLSAQPPDNGVAEVEPLASKFNARLAQMIARGPSPKTKTEENLNTTFTSSTRQGISSPDLDNAPRPSGNAGSLTHVTKTRARGPKRRPPGSKEEGRLASTSTTNSPVSNIPAKEPIAFQASSARRIEAQPVRTPGETSDRVARSVVNNITKLQRTPDAPVEAVRNVSVDLTDRKPSTPGKLSPPAPRTAAKSNLDLSSRSSLPSAEDAVSPHRDTDILAKDRPTKQLGKPIPSPKPKPASPSNLDRQTPPRNTGRVNERRTDSALEQAVSLNKPAAIGDQPAQPLGSEISTPGVLTARRSFADFFQNLSAAAPTFNVDVGRILSEGPDLGVTTKTLHKHIWEITGDGKEKQVPSHREHILFEDKMYICTHTFEAPNGSKTTEVYLWGGDGVSDSAMEDAQLFARKAARERGGKLLKLRQGRETQNFFQALGGILIILRGSSSRLNSSTPYMLCGRRCLGHIAFDEVEFSLDSLCSGYPYIICSSPRKTYLWKGKGSAADELGCARLIAMDFGLAGDLAADLEEVDEGRESAAFFDALRLGSKQNIPPSASYWKLKPHHDEYCARLFYIDLETATKVLEISPFSQTDLDPTCVYCLDAFFEIYIIVGRRAQAKYAQLQTALIFAQAYGALAASKGNRPFVPDGKVVLHGAPRDMQAVFRKWNHEKLTTTTTASPSHRSPAAPSLTVISLSAAIEATKA